MTPKELANARARMSTLLTPNQVRAAIRENTQWVNESRGKSLGPNALRELEIHPQMMRMLGELLEPTRPRRQAAARKIQSAYHAMLRRKAAAMSTALSNKLNLLNAAIKSGNANAAKTLHAAASRNSQALMNAVRRAKTNGNNLSKLMNRLSNAENRMINSGLL